jgi:diacylglycerol kinase family enzyme
MRMPMFMHWCVRILQASILGDISLKLSEQMKLTILQTQRDGPSPKEMAQQALKEGADLIMVSGGDGTVGAVAGALVDTGSHLDLMFIESGCCCCCWNMSRMMHFSRVPALEQVLSCCAQANLENRNWAFGPNGPAVLH